MSNVKERFAESSAQIKDELYDELVKRNYFPRPPEKTREHWKSVAIGLISLVAGGPRPVVATGGASALA